MLLNLISYKLFAGARWSFSETISGYSSSDYALKIYLKKSTGTTITLTGTAVDDGSFAFSKPASETTALVNGDYDYQAVATLLTDESDVTVIASGIVHIYPLLSSSADQRTFWQKQLETLQATYASLCEKEAAELDVNQKKIIYEKKEDVLKQLRVAENEVEKENTEPGSNLYYARFLDR